MQYKLFSKFLLSSILLVLPIFVLAHNPSHSGTLLHQVNKNQWTLQISASLTSFEYEVHNKYGEKSYTTPEEFNALAIKHLLENIIISFNDKDTFKLKKPKIKLGHETKVVFLIDSVPEAINLVTIKNSSFKNISRNQSLLIVSKKGGSKDKFTLNNKNNHTVKLKVNNSKFEMIIAQQRKTNKRFLLWAFATVFIVIVAFIIAKIIYNKNSKILFNK